MTTVGKNKVMWSDGETARLRVAMAIPNRAKRALAFQEFALAGNRTIWSVRCKAWGIGQEAVLENLRAAKAHEPVAITAPGPSAAVSLPISPIRQPTKEQQMVGRAR